MSPEVDEERPCLVGPAITGKFMSVVFSLRRGRFRPISSSIAIRKERRPYEEVRKGLEEELQKELKAIASS